MTCDELTTAVLKRFYPEQWQTVRSLADLELASYRQRDQRCAKEGIAPYNFRPGEVYWLERRIRMLMTLGVGENVIG